MLVINSKLSVPLKEFDFSFSRSSGPGGQNVNKVNTKATMHWKIARNQTLPAGVISRFQEKFRNRINTAGELVLSSQRFRDQGRNVADCLAKLRSMIESIEKAPVIRKKKKTSLASKRHRIEAKRRLGDKKRSRKSPRLDG